MLEALQWFADRNISFWRPSDHHLKCGPINYWPSKGTIVDDRWGRIKAYGIFGLEIVLRNQIEANRPAGSDR